MNTAFKRRVEGIYNILNIFPDCDPIRSVCSELSPDDLDGEVCCIA